MIPFLTGVLFWNLSKRETLDPEVPILHGAITFLSAWSTLQPKHFGPPERGSEDGSELTRKFFDGYFKTSLWYLA